MSTSQNVTLHRTEGVDNIFGTFLFWFLYIVKLHLYACLNLFSAKIAWRDGTVRLVKTP
jgi:hypothetical protein